MKQFEGTEIERRFWGKSEFAEKIGISLSSLRRYRKRWWPELMDMPDFNPHAKVLSPREVELILKKIGWI